jgi:hypothetical protein
MWEERINSFVIKKVGTGDDIAALFYPSREELLYMTSDSRVKVIGMYQFLENSPYSIDAKIIEGNSEKQIIGGNVETGIILTSSLSSLINVDSYKEFTIACLRNKKIKIYNRFGRLIAKILIPVLEKHIYMDECRVRRQKEGELFCLNLCGKHIVAVGTDGKMYLWVLQEEKNMTSAVTNYDVVREEKSNEVTISGEKKKKPSKLRTSFTGKIPNDSKSSTEKRESESKIEQKKSSSSSSGSTPAAKPEQNNPR